MPGVFINYRRDDAKAEAGRLFDWLSRYFGKDQVFMDVSGSIEPGLEFDRVIEKAVSSCDVLVVIIGKEWLTVTDEKGKRRLDDPNDFVRLEVAAALKRDIRVIPVLVQEATMPEEDQLPEDLKRLCKRQASEISDNRWEFDTQLLVKVLEKAGVKANPGQTPVANERSEPAAPATKKIGWKIITSLVLSVLLMFSFAEQSDAEAKVGGLFFALVALVLGVMAFYDTKLNPAASGTRGKVLAISGMVLASIVSLAFIGALTTSHQPNPPPNDSQILPERLVPPPPEPPVPPVPQPAPPANLSGDVSGSWRGPDGIYNFRQSGNDIAFQLFDWNQQLIAQGTGTIAQGVVSVAYARIDNTGGEARLQVSADGRQMAGAYRNHVTGESGPVVLIR